MLFRINRRFHAAIYDRVTRRYETWMEVRKQQLFLELQGIVLELGAGTGANVGCIPRSSLYLAVDRNRSMLDRCRKKLAASNRLAHEHQTFCLLADGECLPVQSESIDSVIVTLVLCSVPNPDSALSEIRRVLKPGGKLFFIEHVRSPSRIGRFVQGLVGPLWSRCADGCRTDQDTARLITSAGFSSISLEDFQVPFPVVPSFLRHHIAGTATR